MADTGYHGCLRLKIASVVRKSWLVDRRDTCLCVRCQLPMAALLGMLLACVADQVCPQCVCGIANVTCNLGNYCRKEM